MCYLKADITKPFHYISCGQFINSHWIHEQRCIDSFEIIYGTKGCLYIQQDGTSYEVTEGKSLLLLPGHIHRGYRTSEDEVSFYWIHFKCSGNFSFLNGNSTGAAGIPYFSWCTGEESSCCAEVPVFFEPPERGRLIVLIKQLLDSSRGGYAEIPVCNYFVTLIFMELSRQNTVAFVQQQSTDSTGRKLAAMSDWLRINKNCTAGQLAARFNFNKDYLCRIFKKYTGMTVIKYINHLKMEKAEQLLRETDLSIKEIADMLGFSDCKYFMKIFKTYETLTPSTYRNSYYRTHINDR